MFEHSIKVPRLYKVSAKILRQVKEEGGSLKELVYQQKHFNIKALYALVAAALQRFSEIELIIKKSELFIKEPRFDPWLAKVLTTELLWGKKQLPNHSTPLKTILSYRETLEKLQTTLNLQPQHENTNKVQKLRFVRINTLTISVEDAIYGFCDEGWRLIRLANNSYEEYLSRIATLNDDEFLVDLHIKELLVFPSSAKFYNHAAYKMGSILLQDKASCLPSHLLNPPPGSTVLDMCAAPGMKTTHLAALLNNRGTIYAVEKDENRFNTLNKFIEKVHQTCIKTINKDVLQVTSEECPNVEYILVDPSCSGSGIRDRVQVDGKSEIPDSKRLEKLAGFQILILKHALFHFPSAKRVVYSTCSIYPQENEYVIEEVLKSVNKFELVSVRNLLNGSWKNSSTSEDDNSITEKCLYMKPENDLTNGFFIAVFDRINSVDTIPSKIVKKKEKNKKQKNVLEDAAFENKTASAGCKEINEDENNENLLDKQSNNKIKKRKTKHLIPTEYEETQAYGHTKVEDNGEDVTKNTVNEENHNKIIDDFCVVKKSKKKKIKQDECNNEEQDPPDTFAKNTNNCKFKKKKKHKSKIKDLTTNTIVTSEIDVDLEKQCKKRKTHDLLKTDNETSGTTNETSSKVTKRKKCKNEKADREKPEITLDSLQIVNVGAELGMKTAKTKRKHKSEKHTTLINDVQSTEQLEYTTKKKKKTKDM